MKLAEALQTGPLQTARLVAGLVSDQHEITWVQAVDHPEIAPWVEAGYLLLSTGYSWPREEQAAYQLVADLAAKQIAGVVLAVPHFLDHFPAASLAAAHELGLPLLEIPWAVPFSEITQFIHRELIDQQGRALARSEQIHRQLTQAAVSGQSLLDVAQVLAEVLARSVVMYAVDGKVLASAHGGGGGGSQSPRPEALYEQLATQRWWSRINAATEAIRLQLTEPTLGLAAYAVRVRDERVGMLVVLDQDLSLSAMDLRAIEHAGTVAALQIAHQRELSSQEARLGYALVAALIEGHFDNDPKSLERAALLGWNAGTPYRLCTLLMDEPNPLSRDGFAKRELLAEQLRQSLLRRGLRPLLSVSANQIHLLLPHTLAPAEVWTPLLPTHMAMAVSQVHAGVPGMARCGRECAELLAHLKPGQLHAYADMLLPRVLAGDPQARRELMDRVLGQLDPSPRGQQLLSTCLALADEGFHLQRTADRLGLHISSLRHRIERLQTETGLDFSSVDGRFQVELAARLYRMEGR